MNEYLEDASRLLKRVAANIDENMSDDLTIDTILLFALGVERILKGILYDINPIYVFKTQDFKYTMALLYKRRLLPGKVDKSEIEPDPEGDVLAFRTSLLRVRAISETTWNYSGTLFGLANVRDVIAHKPLSELDIDKARVLLQRDFYPLMRSYSSELNIPLSRFISSLEIRLSTISAKQQESLQSRVSMRLESHRMRWDVLNKMPGFVEKMKARTEILLQQNAYESTTCPSCGNEALLTVKAGHDTVQGEEIPFGRLVTELKCLFCKLNISDYDEIDYLKLNERTSSEFE